MTAEANDFRHRAIRLSQQVKWIFCAIPGRFGGSADGLLKWIAGRFFLGPIMRWLFLGPDGVPHRAGEIVLAELRREAGFSRASNFHIEPLVMAQREGKRELAMWFFKHLNLDEAKVQKLVELDDGSE